MLSFCHSSRIDSPTDRRTDGLLIDIPRLHNCSAVITTKNNSEAETRLVGKNHCVLRLYKNALTYQAPPRLLLMSLQRRVRSLVAHCCLGLCVAHLRMFKNLITPMIAL